VLTHDNMHLVVAPIMKYLLRSGRPISRSRCSPGRGLSKVVRAMTSSYGAARRWLVATVHPLRLDDWVGRFTEREPRE
jgi:hypothetical protein